MESIIEFRRSAEAIRRSGLKKTAYYGQIKRGLQMPMVAIAGRAVGVAAHEQDAILAARLAGQTDDQIRAIIAALLAARKQPQKA